MVGVEKEKDNAGSGGRYVDDLFFATGSWNLVTADGAGLIATAEPGALRCLQREIFRSAGNLMHRPNYCCNKANEAFFHEESGLKYNMNRGIPQRFPAAPALTSTASFESMASAKGF